RANDRSAREAGGARREVGVVRVPELHAALPVGQPHHAARAAQGTLLQPPAVRREAEARRVAMGVDVSQGAPAHPVPGVAELRDEILKSFFKRFVRTIRFIISHRLYTWRYWVCLFRFVRLKITKPHIKTEGFVFLGPKVDLHARRGYGRLTLGRWVF